MNERKWGVGSSQYRKLHGASNMPRRTPASFASPTVATTGRVSWDRNAIDFTQIPESDQGRAIFRFRKALPDLIWNTAALEGNTFTLPEVRTLLDGVTVGGKRQEEAEQILALSEGMEAMLAHVEAGDFLLSKRISDEIHGLIARHEAIESGVFRGEGKVYGGGAVRLAGGGIVEGDPAGDGGELTLVGYENLLAAVGGLADGRERALAYFASATRSQFYFDGNKRTARIMMAGELMSNGFEAVSVPYARAVEFNRALDLLFKTDEATELIEFLTTCTPPNIQN